MSVFDLFRDDEGLSGFPALVEGLVKDVASLVWVVFLLTPFPSIRQELGAVVHAGAGSSIAAFGILLGVATISRCFLRWGRTFFTLAVALAIFLAGFVVDQYGWITLGYVASGLFMVPALGCILAARYKPGLIIAIPALILTAIFGPIRNRSIPTGSTEEHSHVEVDCGKVDGE